MLRNSSSISFIICCFTSKPSETPQPAICIRSMHSTTPAWTASVSRNQRNRSFVQDETNSVCSFCFLGCTSFRQIRSRAALLQKPCSTRRQKQKPEMTHCLLRRCIDKTNHSSKESLFKKTKWAVSSQTTNEKCRRQG